LLFLVVALPAVLGFVGIVLDGGMLYSTREDLRHAGDAAATAAAVDLWLGRSTGGARQTADDYLRDLNAFDEAIVETNIPPGSGPYAGRSGFVEVIAEYPYQTKIIHLVGASQASRVRTRSVAGPVPSTAGAAIVVLDPGPPAVSVGITLPLVLNFPALLGGLEVEGLGTVSVDGAVLVNTAWGGVDEQGNPAGETSGPPYGISCTPLLPLTRLRARDIRVVGGVDRSQNYAAWTAGQSSPLKANRLPVPDPFAELPVPADSIAPADVDTTLRGGVRVVGLPLIGPPTVLRPGIYEYIEVVSGNVVFQPGIYIIRGKSPLTSAALSIVGGTVVGEGVMFYITDSPTFDPVGGSPDQGDHSEPTAPQTLALTPSVVINAALPGSRLTPLSSVGSPFNGMLLYQRRQDYRPIVVVCQNLIGSTTISGTIYAKRGHFIFAGDGTHDLRIVAGSVRLAPVLGLTLAPSQPLPPARDVYLVE
jgi:hypothetical protein